MWQLCILNLKFEQSVKPLTLNRYTCFKGCLFLIGELERLDFTVQTESDNSQFV